MEVLWEWFVNFNRFSALSGSLYFLSFVRKYHSVPVLIFSILLASFLADNLNFFFIRLITKNSFYISDTWVMLNFFLVSNLLMRLNEQKKLAFIGSSLFVIGAVISYVFFFEFGESNTFIRVSSNLFIIICSLLVYLKLLKNASTSLKSLPSFWMATSFFIYNSIVLMISLFNNYLIFDLNVSSEGYSVIGIINLTANISKNLILFCVLVLIDKGFPVTPNKNTA